jgi:transcriptional regulator with XRE-family HTH domain
VHDVDLPDRVRQERELRGLSVRKAAELGGVSNETWGKYERQLTGLSPKIRTAVATVFGWPMDWPERPPRPARSGGTMPLDAVSQLRREVEELALVVQEQAHQIGELMGVVAELTATRGAAGSGR